jgi:hypothetical protein
MGMPQSVLSYPHEVPCQGLDGSDVCQCGRWMSIRAAARLANRTRQSLSAWLTRHRYPRDRYRSPRTRGGEKVYVPSAVVDLYRLERENAVRATLSLPPVTTPSL